MLSSEGPRAFLDLQEDGPRCSCGPVLKLTFRPVDFFRPWGLNSKVRMYVWPCVRIERFMLDAGDWTSRAGRRSVRRAHVSYEYEPRRATRLVVYS